MSTLKIGMLAPSRSGKTSLMTALFMTLQKVYGANNVFYGDDETEEKIADSIDTFSRIMETSDNADPLCIDGLIIRGSEGVGKPFKFDVALQEGSSNNSLLRQSFEILDYAGGLLKKIEFKVIEKYLNECAVMLVPISSDLLLRAWAFREDLSKFKAAANIGGLYKSLVIEKILAWIENRQKELKESYLIFVPVKCEAYFDDNNCVPTNEDKESAKKIFKAIEQFYVEPVREKAKELKHIHIRGMAVDTYGTVQLKECRYVTLPDGSGRWNSVFVKILKCYGQKELSIKGVQTILDWILKFSLEGTKAEIANNEAAIEIELGNASGWDTLKNWFNDHVNPFIEEGDLTKKRRKLNQLKAEEQSIEMAIAKMGRNAEKVSPLRQVDFDKKGSTERRRKTDLGTWMYPDRL